MKMVGNNGRHRAGKKRAIVLLVIAILGLLIILAACQFRPTPVADVTSTSSPMGTPTCPDTVQLSTPVGVNVTTKLVIIVYDPWAAVNPGLDLASGERLTSVPVFITHLISDIVKPGDEISVFHTGVDSYTAARVTRQYSYLSTYPQLYVPPSFITLTPLPPTGVPTPGYGEVATKNAYRGVVTQRAATETAYKANFDCDAMYFNKNIQATATTWKQEQVNDVNSIATAASNDFATMTPVKGKSEELLYGSWYYGLYFASVDFQADCAKYDSCDLVLIGDLHVYRKNNPDKLPISLNGINIYTIMPGCRDINQPDCADLQSYWSSEFTRFGASKSIFWNGVRSEVNLLGEIGR